MRGRTIIVAMLALVSMVLVVRTAFVDAYASSDPVKAAAIWPGHPSVILASGLEEIGRHAAAGRPADKAMVDRLVATAIKDPLAPEPFLVRGVEAQLAGNEALAGRAYVAARDRQPRAVAARYFLAAHYLRTGQIQPGLSEISSLTRLVPQSLDKIGPYLAAYARSEGATAQVKLMLLRNPRLEPVLLNELAVDARDARLALLLWSGRGGETARPWQARMVNTLVAAGRFEEGHAAWLRFTGGPVLQDQLIDTNFQSQALPPFGWTLASGSAGVAEPEEGDRIHVLYYGRDNLVLASRLMMLKPGSYRLSMQVSGASPLAKSLAWKVRCLPSSAEIANVELADARKGGVLGVGFAAPATGCNAQSLELTGLSPEFPEQAEVTITSLKLEREVAR
jgi:hypothetical protein